MKTIKKTVLPYKNNPNYLVYNDGRIYSKYKNKFLSPYKNKKGYLYIVIRINGVSKSKQIGRLVAEVFIPNPQNKPTTNHKNGIKGDNRIENLEWATYLENNRHAIEVLGKKTSEETKRKIGLSSRDRRHSKEVRNKISIARMGMKFSEETKNKMSIAKTGTRHSEETKKKIGKANRKSLLNNQNARKAILIIKMGNENV